MVNVWRRILCDFPMVMSSYHRQRNNQGRSASLLMVLAAKNLEYLVWAKTGKYPWWPAETCLLAVDELTKHFPPNPFRATARRREGDDDGFVLRTAACKWMLMDADHDRLLRRRLFY